MTIRDAVALARKELVETSLEDAEFEARQRHFASENADCTRLNLRMKCRAMR